MTRLARSSGAATREQLLASLKASRRYDIGFPGASDLTFPDLDEWLTRHLLNNVGDPYDPGRGRNHTKHLEREVVDIVAGWFNAPALHWGYVTSGASEGTEHALDDAWQQYPDLVVYTSAAAHYSVVKSARKLKLPLVMVRTLPDGAIDIDDLAGELKLRRHQPAMIVATIGTTMTEAFDDVGAIVAVCDDLAITRRRIHVDAALSGIPLALMPEATRPVAFDFTVGADSIVVSGHKFLSTLRPCAVLVYAEDPYRSGRRVPYTGSADSTVFGSRSGHAPLILHAALTDYDVDAHRARAVAARRLADYTCQRLTDIGWFAWHNPHSFTVVLDTPPSVVTDKWVLAGNGHQSHVITMPGIAKDQIDEFIADVRAALPAVTIPAQRPKHSLTALFSP